MKQTIMMLSGAIGIGKTTLAQNICDYHLARGRRIEVVSFAFPIKLALLKIANVDTRTPRTAFNERKTQLFPGSTRTWREAAQLLGTEWGRNLMGQDIWADLACKYIRTHGTSAIIDDLRFHSEAAFIRQRFPNTRLFQLQRHEVPIATSTHDSELEWATIPDSTEIFVPSDTTSLDYDHLITRLAALL